MLEFIQMVHVICSVFIEGCQLKFETKALKLCGLTVLFIRSTKSTFNQVLKHIVGAVNFINIRSLQPRFFEKLSDLGYEQTALLHHDASRWRSQGKLPNHNEVGQNYGVHLMNDIFFIQQAYISYVIFLKT